MKYKLVAWVFGILLLLSGLLLLVVSVPAGILMIVAAGFLLPPVRDYTHKKTYLIIPAFARVVIVLLAIYSAGHLSQRSSFERNPEILLAEARSAAKNEDWEQVMFLTKDLLSTNHPELTNLYNKAKAEKQKLEKANAARKVIEEAARKIEEECNDAAGAYVASQEFVKKLLKSPATADFPSITDNEVTINYQGDCRLKVFAYVDSQNSFGALIRSGYYAELKKIRSDKSWQLIDIQLRQ